MNTTPNGIRTESERIRFVSIEVRNSTQLHANNDRLSIHTSPRRPIECECPPCPGRGNDGHRLTHCAECCFGTGVEADLDCPKHGDPAYSLQSVRGRILATQTRPMDATTGIRGGL